MRVLTTLKLCILTLLCLIFCNYALAQDNTTIKASANENEIGDNTAKDDQQIYFLYNGIDLATTLKFHYPKAKTMIKSVYPLLNSENEDEAIENFNLLVEQFIKATVDNFTKQVTALKSNQAQLPKALVKNDLYIDYDSSFINLKDQHILSVRFTIVGVNTGNTRGFHYHQVLNYDLDSGDTLELADIFLPEADYLSQLSTYARKILEKRLVNKAMIIPGTAPVAENFKIWNLKPYGLIITFEESQVAPAIYGAQTVVIPYSALKDIIDPDSPIFSCVQNKARCSRNNLLTGGFIDEAINARHSRLDPVLS